MDSVFELIDKNKRKVHLSKERYKHILKHPRMYEPLDNIKITLQNPTTMTYNEEDDSVIYFYKEFKQNNPQERYLLVSVKYLNGEGFVITSFFTNRITGLKWKTK